MSKVIKQIHVDRFMRKSAQDYKVIMKNREIRHLYWGKHWFEYLFHINDLTREGQFTSLSFLWSGSPWTLQQVRQKTSSPWWKPQWLQSLSSLLALKQCRSQHRPPSKQPDPKELKMWCKNFTKAFPFLMGLSRGKYLQRPAKGLDVNCHNNNDNNNSNDNRDHIMISRTTFLKSLLLPTRSTSKQ